MKRIVIPVLMILSILPAVAQSRSTGTAPETLQYPPLGKTESEKRILSTISDAVRAGELYANVPAIDGQMLRVLAESTNAKHVLEIGTSTGISGLWFLLALESTGGRLTTLEIDPRRAALARFHFKKAGVDELVTLVEGDAHQNVTTVKGPLDVVFIDAEKDGYVELFQQSATAGAAGRPHSGPQREYGSQLREGRDGEFGPRDSLLYARQPTGNHVEKALTLPARRRRFRVTIVDSGLRRIRTRGDNST